MNLLERCKSFIEELKKDAQGIDEKNLKVLFLTFLVVDAAMCIANLCNGAFLMALVTIVVFAGMTGLLFLYYRTKQQALIIGGVLVFILGLVAYLLVKGGEQGFGIFWLLLIPYLVVFALRLYYGGMIGILLVFIVMLYMWTPLYELGYQYPDIYRERFPLIYFVCLLVSVVIQLQVFQFQKKEKEAYQRIEEANEVKSIFLSSMSHEARTPINAVLGYNEMILRESKEKNTISYAKNIQATARTLLSIVNDTLDFTSIQEGNLYLEKEPYSVLTVLQDLTSYGAFNAEKKKIDFRLELSETLPQGLVGDAARLGQVCKNLISNAIKYTNSGYVVLDFSWKTEDETRGILKVSVRDTGIGIKEEDIAKLGTTFTRIDGSNTRHIQGVGLGLPLVMRLLEMMGSSLKIQSVYGQGSEFSFDLPQEIATATGISMLELMRRKTNIVAEEKEAFTVTDAHILIVDDNVMNLDILKGILRRRGVIVDMAMNGKEAIERIRENIYDLIIMDHMMPVMDGMETLRIIRKGNLCPAVPIVVLTANAVAGAKEMYLEAGFAAYLAKPVGSIEVDALLKRFLSGKIVMAEVEEQKKAKLENGAFHGKNLLERLNFLDVATGLAYCCDNESFYRDMLKSFVDNEKLEDIEAFYEKKDWENYRICVHALKSSAMSIGAVELSEQARLLEVAAKEENHYYIDRHHFGVMESYRQLLVNIDDALTEKKDTKAEITVEISGHILVVDDDPVVLKSAENILSKRFELGIVSSGKDALQYLRHHKAELILLDLHMPDMDGFELMEKLKKKDATKDIPVIFLKTAHEHNVEIKGYKLGAQDFITKPFVADVMIQRISHVLELSRLQKDLHKEVEKQTKWAEERRQKLERLTDQVMETLAGTIDAKDKYTNGHSIRVAQYSVELAKRAGKDEKEQERIYFMGMLHDIGKIGIPDSIITKQSGLSDEEYSLTRQHPLIGAEILENISEIPKLGVGARWHHERYDGKGYPDGLSGEEIPEEARLIAVADAYDAMASKRSYRDVLPQNDVYDEIKAGIGTQFDPVYASIMLKMIEEDVEYCMREK